MAKSTAMSHEMLVLVIFIICWIALELNLNIYECNSCYSETRMLYYVI